MVQFLYVFRRKMIAHHGGELLYEIAEISHAVGNTTVGVVNDANAPFAVWVDNDVFGVAIAVYNGLFYFFKIFAIECDDGIV